GGLGGGGVGGGGGVVLWLGEGEWGVGSGEWGVRRLLASGFWLLTPPLFPVPPSLQAADPLNSPLPHSPTPPSPPHRRRHA
ncbi:MAG: hypothetical protein AAFW75_29785, partial [Cyanobacteria bacterium J06636_16]